MILYHGSPKLFDHFQLFEKKTFSNKVSVMPIFLSPNVEFAKLNATANGYIYTIKVKTNNIFSTELLYKPDHKYWPPAYNELTDLGKEFIDDLYDGKIFSGQTEFDYEFIKHFLSEHYDVMETKEIMEYIKDKGFDGFCVIGDGPRNVAIFNPADLEILDVQKVNKTAQLKQNYDYSGNFVDKVKRRNKRKNRIKKLSSLEGRLPDFKILEKAVVFNREINNNKFIDLNSDIIARINPVEYIGSGEFGDAFLTDDNKVFKICNPRDLDKYKDLYNKQFQGSANINQPKIYEVGRFKYKINSTGIEYYNFGYVLMEKVRTLKTHLQNYKYVSIDLQEIDPYYYPMIMSSDNPIIKIIFNVKQRIFKYIKKYLRYFKIKPDANLNTLSLSKKIYKTFLENNPDVNDYLIKMIANILEINNDWIEKIILTCLDLFKNKHGDFHEHNYGYRGNEPVFFDF
jgi:hypothetical protein